MKAPPKRINKHNGVGNYLHGRWINSIFWHYFQENLQQPRFWATYVNRKWTFVLFSRDFEQILGQIVSLRVNTLSNTNLAASRHINEKKAYIWLKNVSQKTSVLNINSILTLNVTTLGARSQISRGTSFRGKNKTVLNACRVSESTC